MVDGQSGKGDTYRKVDKRKFDKNYKKIFGDKCICDNGYFEDEWTDAKGIKHKCRTKCILCAKGDKNEI